MEDDWQNLADEIVQSADPLSKVIAAVVNKWEGEDEDDDIKDSWDADDDEKKDEEKIEKAPAKPKKTLQQKLAEKEKLKLEQEEKRRIEKEDEEMANMTPEERAAEKVRLRQLEIDEYTKVSLDSLGLTSSSDATADGPSTKEEFAEFSSVISKQILKHKTKEEFVPFLDELVKTLCAGLSSTNIKRIRSTLDNLHLAQSKMEKGDKPKKKAKGKGTLRMEADDDYSSRAGAFEADDFDDFM